MNENLNFQLWKYQFECECVTPFQNRIGVKLLLVILSSSPFISKPSLHQKSKQNQKKYQKKKLVYKIPTNSFLRNLPSCSSPSHVSFTLHPSASNPPPHPNLRLPLIPTVIIKGHLRRRPLRAPPRHPIVATNEESLCLFFPPSASLVLVPCERSQHPPRIQAQSSATSFCITDHDLRPVTQISVKTSTKARINQDQFSIVQLFARVHLVPNKNPTTQFQSKISVSIHWSSYSARIHQQTRSKSNKHLHKFSIKLTTRINASSVTDHTHIQWPTSSVTSSVNSRPDLQCFNNPETININHRFR